MSNIGMFATLYIVVYASFAYGFGSVLKFYGIPWLALNHWCTHFSMAIHSIRADIHA
jgi:omega-6 fatty acid desaturase (delta-12 desaturase)